MTLRKANLNDISRLSELYRMLLLHEQGFGPFHYCTEGLVSNRAELYKNIITTGEGFILIDEERGNIVGMLAAQYVPAETGHPLQRPVLIQDAFFMPEYQKKGLGTKMFDKTLALCKKDGRDAIHLWVAPENTFLDKVLEEKYGFKTVYHLKSLKI